MATAQNQQQSDRITPTSPSTAARATGTQASTAQSGPASAGYNGPTAPGIRKDNPLSRFSSYTYGLGLYMVTPTAMNAFINSGGSLSTLLGKNTGVYVVAQSGGTNNANEDRLLTLDHKPGTSGGYDYYIDDMTITTLLPGGPNKATVGTEIKFKIIEPQSFTFLQDMSRASAELNKLTQRDGATTSTNTTGNEPNAFQQHYIIGIKFYGYDVDGNLITASSPLVTGYDNGSSGDQNAVIQRYFSIKITSIKFKLDGKIVTYQCEAVVLAEQVAYGQINGTIKSQTTITAGTVGQALSASYSVVGSRSLEQVINEQLQALKDDEKINLPGKIKIEFLDNDGDVTTNSEIAKSGLIDDATFTSVTAPLTKALTTDKVTIADSFKAVTIDKTKKTVSTTAGQNILTFIDNIIVKSNYVGDALREIASQDAEGENVAKPSKKTLSWYTVNPIVKVLGRDKITNNWAYDITYQIKPYDIPYIRTTLAGAISKYPGPYKFYNYLYTGKNTEIIAYEQQYDNLFYTVSTMSTNKDSASTGNKGSAPTGVQNGTATDKTTGNQNTGSRLNEEVAAQLYSPGDQSQAKIKILGDPDYIMTTTGVNASVDTISKFYGPGNSINPHGGQVFIQVVFDMATDYADDGLLTITDQLQFYKTNRVKKAGIDGIVYTVYQVDSSFSKGTFTQTLECLMADETILVFDNPRGSANNSDTSSGSPGQQQAQNSRFTGINGTSTTVTRQISSPGTAITANPQTTPASASEDIRTLQIREINSYEIQGDSSGGDDGGNSGPPANYLPTPPTNTADDDAVVPGGSVLGKFGF